MYEILVSSNCMALIMRTLYVFAWFVVNPFLESSPDWVTHRYRCAFRVDKCSWKNYVVHVVFEGRSCAQWPHGMNVHLVPNPSVAPSSPCACQNLSMTCGEGIVAQSWNALDSFGFGMCLALESDISTLLEHVLAFPYELCSHSHHHQKIWKDRKDKLGPRNL